MPKFILFAFFFVVLSAQSRLDWRLPVQSGTTVPSSCSAGRIFIKTDATAGSNLYACVNGSFVVQGGTPGTVLLEQKTASSSATLDFTSCISSTYDTYELHFLNLVPATNNARLIMTISANAGSSWISTNYIWRRLKFWNTQSEVGGSTSDSSFAVGIEQSSSTLDLSGQMTIHAPATAFRYLFAGQNYDGNYVSTEMRGSHATTGINALRFAFSSGSITSGIIRCYGVQK